MLLSLLPPQFKNQTPAATNKGSQFSNNSIIPAYIKFKYLLVEKCRAWAKWHRFKYPVGQAVFNYLKNKLSRAIQERKETKDLYIQNPSTTDSSLLKATNKLVSHKQSSPPICNSNNSWATTDIDKAYVFAKHLVCVFQSYSLCPSET